MTEQAIYNVVLHYADKVSVGKIAPHDLRRTFAKLATKVGQDSIKFSYPWAIAQFKRPERYLGTEQDLTDAPCDHLGLRL